LVTRAEVERKLAVSPIGFTENLHQWMALSSIVIAVIEGKAIQSKFLDVGDLRGEPRDEESTLSAAPQGIADSPLRRFRMQETPRNGHGYRT
jgi:hypothetical protein